TVVKSITVWNGNEKVNSIGRFSTGIANIAFTKIVTVPAGQTVKLPIKINVNNTAGIASELKISLLEVKSDTALAGTFPMVGNAFTISEVDLGEIEAKISGDAPVASLNAGDKDVRLAKFDFEVRSEAQTIKRIVFSQDGTAADTDLANLRLVDEDGTVLAKGEMNRGELVFDLNRECASGTTARLTIRGDVVGGAGRTIQFSIDNVNDIQSVGKVYGTTIIANGTIDGSKLTVEKGAFILTKSASSPAAATVATTVDDQKFAAIKVEAIGEPIQLETVSVSIKSSDTETSDKKVREIKLVSNGVIIASQEIKKNDDVSNVELPLSEVVTVEPNSPITIDVLIDLKDAVKDKTYEVGIFKIDGSGLVSEKDISFNKDEIEDEVIYGSLMTVGDIKVTLEQKAQVNGYVFPNQSEEILAEFNIKHNLGETVRLSALKVKIAKGDNADAGNDLVAKTFKNVKLVSASGSVVSETVINPTTSELNIALKEGVTVEAGKTIRLGLMADIRAGANPGDVFKFAAIDASSVTIATGTTVSASKTSEEIESAIADSRSVEISSGATEEDVKANKSDEVLKDKNVVANTSNVEIARWKLTNESNEDVGVNKVYLTAKYNGQTPKDGQKRDLQRAYVQCVLKDDKGTVLTDTSEPFTLNKNVVTEIDILKDSNRSKLLIDAANNSGDGERELILYANIADGAQVGGSISVQLGSDVDNGNLFEITGRISGLTTTVKGNPIESDNKTTVSVSVVNANALSGNKNVTENEYSSKNGVKGETLGKFSIKNTGKTAVGVRQIVLRLDDQSDYGDEIKKLELYDSDGNKVALDPVSDWVEIKKANEVVVANPNYGTISKWLEIYENHEDENIKNIYDNDTPDDDNSADAIIEKAHKYVIFNIASSKIKISAGKDEVFEVRTESDKLLPTGSKITLFVDKAHTYTDKASFDGYEICLDNEKDVNLGTVEVKAKN
ncbi:MAG: hypothetical protein J6Y29_00815, partial [Clostridiales bacterium]|nr:hypothetical protein [Clostridiales bacterium]